MQMHAHYLEAQSISAGAHTWRAGAEEDFPYGRMLLLETREERQGLRNANAAASQIEHGQPTRLPSMLR